MAKPTMLIRSSNLNLISELENNLNLKTLLNATQTDNLISITEVEIFGQHQRLQTNSYLRIYYIIHGEVEFQIDQDPSVKLVAGDLLTISSGSQYELFGKAKYLVINTPAFQESDDDYSNNLL